MIEVLANGLACQVSLTPLDIYHTALTTVLTGLEITFHGTAQDGTCDPYYTEPRRQPWVGRLVCPFDAVAFSYRTSTARIFGSFVEGQVLTSLETMSVCKGTCTPGLRLTRDPDRTTDTLL